ncbi:uncharacterized protein LOC117320071, partial [Pecten maximus]|uniref:uncharacterized protein LOC117320071 n=1 Tax=Pecten maximus TaxID=6579 RepID=UPI0014582472
TLSQSYTGSSHHHTSSSGGARGEETTRFSSVSVDDSVDSGRPSSPPFIHDMPVLQEDQSQEDESDDDSGGVDDDELRLATGYDDMTLSVLKVVFPPFYYSTHGLSRPCTPTEDDKPRYYQLVDKAIDSYMVSPVSKETIQGIYNFVPKELRMSVPAACKHFLKEMDEDRKYAIKKAILDYILLDHKEQERLGVWMPEK